VHRGAGICGKWQSVAKGDARLRPRPFKTTTFFSVLSLALPLKDKEESRVKSFLLIIFSYNEKTIC
jgi:hypothetical protein